MFFTVIFLSLLLLTGLFFAWQARDFLLKLGRSLFETEEEELSLPGTADLSQSLIIIGKDVNARHCSNQRYELKRILPALTRRQIRIVEIYGDDAPLNNGKVDPSFDNELLRESLDAGEGFHLILVDERQRTCLRSIFPIGAEALFHILDLQDMLPEPSVSETDEDEEETPSATTAPVADLPDAEDVTVANHPALAEIVTGDETKRAPDQISAAIRRRYYSAAAE